MAPVNPSNRSERRWFETLPTQGERNTDLLIRHALSIFRLFIRKKYDKAGLEGRVYDSNILLKEVKLALDRAQRFLNDTSVERSNPRPVQPTKPASAAVAPVLQPPPAPVQEQPVRPPDPGQHIDDVQTGSLLRDLLNS